MKVVRPYLALLEFELRSKISGIKMRMTYRSCSSLEVTKRPKLAGRFGGNVNIDEFKRFFADICSANLAGQQRRVNQDVQNLNRHDAATGQFGSGGHYKRIFAILRAELAARSGEFCEGAQRTCDALGAESGPDLLEVLKDSVTSQIDTAAVELKLIFGNEIAADMQRHFSFDELRSEVVAKSDVEIALYVGALKKSSAAKLSASHNYYGSVGAVQHGAGSTATVTQTISSDDSAKIAVALQEILREIRQSSHLDPRMQGDMVDLVQSGEEIIKAETPNRFKLSGLIAGLKDVVDIIPKAKDAYEVVVASAQTLLS